MSDPAVPVSSPASTPPACCAVVGVRRRLHMEGPPSTDLPSVRGVPAAALSSPLATTAPPSADPTNGGDGIDITSIDVEDVSRPVSVHAHSHQHSASTPTLCEPPLQETFPLPSTQAVASLFGASFSTPAREGEADSYAPAAHLEGPVSTLRQPQQSWMDVCRGPHSTDALVPLSVPQAETENVRGMADHNYYFSAPLPRLPSGTISPPRVKPRATKPLVKKAPSVRPPSPTLTRVASAVSSRSPPGGAGTAYADHTSSSDASAPGGGGGGVPALAANVVRSPASRPVVIDASPSPRAAQGIRIPPPRARGVHDRGPDASREDCFTHDAFQRRGDVRTPLLRHRLVQTDDVRFYGVGLRSPPRPSLSSTDAAPLLVSIGKESESHNMAEKPAAALLREPILCSAWTTTKSSTFINNF